MSCEISIIFHYTFRASQLKDITNTVEPCRGNTGAIDTVADNPDPFSYDTDGDMEIT